MPRRRRPYRHTLVERLHEPIVNGSSRNFLTAYMRLRGPGPRTAAARQRCGSESLNARKPRPGTPPVRSQRGRSIKRGLKAAPSRRGPDARAAVGLADQELLDHRRARRKRHGGRPTSRRHAVQRGTRYTTSLGATRRLRQDPPAYALRDQSPPEQPGRTRGPELGVTGQIGRGAHVHAGQRRANTAGLAPTCARRLDRHPGDAAHVDPDRRQDPAGPGADGQPLVAGDPLRHPAWADHVSDSRTGTGVFDIEFDFVDHRLRSAASDGGQAAVALRARSRWPTSMPRRWRPCDAAGDRRADPGPAQRGRARDPVRAGPPARVVRPARGAAVLAAAGAGAPGDHAVPVRTSSARSARCTSSGAAWTWPAPASPGGPRRTHPGGAPNCGDWVMVEGYSHELSSCGFWPGGGEEGAFYSYAYPEPEGFADYAGRTRGRVLQHGVRAVPAAVRGGPHRGRPGHGAAAVPAHHLLGGRRTRRLGPDRAGGRPPSVGPRAAHRRAPCTDVSHASIAYVR